MTYKHLFLGLLLLVLLSLLSCVTDSATNSGSDFDKSEHERSFSLTLQKHLAAISSQDTTALRKTLSPEGKMQLILPKMEVMRTVNSFMDSQKAWFQDTPWTFQTTVLDTDVGIIFGLATVEAIYREPERNGQPYFNRMFISYALEKVDGHWYVIKDHASSVEKSTD